MSYRQADIKKIKRLIILLLRLDAAPAGGINLQHFAAMANVNIRTLQRDIKLLNECLNLTEEKQKTKGKKALCYIERKGHGNYGFKEGYSLANAQQEKIFHDTIEPLAESLGMSPAVFRAYWRLSPQDNPLFIKFPQQAEPLKLISGFETLLEAIQKKYTVTITRKDASGKKIAWKGFKPLKICFSEGFWYVIGYFDRQIIKYRLESIANVQPDKKCRHFAYNPEHDPKQAIEYILRHAVGMWFNSDHTTQTIKLFVKKPIASYFKKKIYFPQQQILQETADGLILTCVSSDEAEIKNSIFPTVQKWLPNIIIFSPKKLAADFRAQLQQYLAQNK